MPISQNKRLNVALKNTDEYLKRYLDVDLHFSKKIINHITCVGGKRIRAKATILTSLGSGKINPKVEKLAAAIELFHQATLIHDDVIDAAQLRRGKGSVNRSFGNEVAVMFGDYLFTKVMNWMIQEMPVTVQKIVARAITEVCLGEIEEIGARLNYYLSESDYKKIIQYKTAALFGSACEASAVLSGASQAIQKCFKKYGMAIGMAFQIQDDILDMSGTVKKLGKQPGIDIKEGRITLPLILAFQYLSVKDQRQLKTALKEGPQKYILVKKLLDKCNALEDAKKRALMYVKKAELALKPLPVSQAKEELLKLADFSVAREQ